MATPAAADEVLFFIPDLGGFTKFIAETEIQHSQHIIKELLEILVDANTLGMKVSEFEGDAVLFYRNGAPPSLDQLVQQARKMYVDFHAHLKKFEYNRVCQCGACAGASGIALKMVAHFGSAGTMQVKNHLKFIGKDIIIAHRLLKNSVTVLSICWSPADPVQDSGRGRPARLLRQWFRRLRQPRYDRVSRQIARRLQGRGKGRPASACRAEGSAQDGAGDPEDRCAHRARVSAADRPPGTLELDRGRDQSRNVRRPTQPHRQDASMRPG
jgi:hypothetical protein